VVLGNASLFSIPNHKPCRILFPAVVESHNNKNINALLFTSFICQLDKIMVMSTSSTGKVGHDGLVTVFRDDYSFSSE